MLDMPRGISESTRVSAPQQVQHTPDRLAGYAHNDVFVHDTLQSMQSAFGTFQVFEYLEAHDQVGIVAAMLHFKDIPGLKNTGIDTLHPRIGPCNVYHFTRKIRPSRVKALTVPTKNPIALTATHFVYGAR
jgi:hypothetical protein